jgi:hypothetical protein
MSNNLIDVPFNSRGGHHVRYPSICIPRVFKHISNAFIVDIFQHKLGLGFIKKIDTIPNHSDGQFKKIFIHFDFWQDDEKTNSIKNKLLQGVVLKVVYDGPWFWKCSLTRDKHYHSIRK